MDKYPIICILGPTASGKTELALHLADTHPCALINVDSAQIYQEMNIGTAKPDCATLHRYPHALVDIIAPEESYSAARFTQEATLQIQHAHKIGRIPVLVGGTMLYYQALFAGLANLPSSDPKKRADIEARIATEGLDSLYQRLITLDTYAAAKLKANDRQRIIRFTELYETTGKTPSELFAIQSEPNHNHWQIRTLALEPPRTLLHQRIATRFRQMMAQGLLDEVAALHQRPSLTAEHPSMRAVGYRQIWQYLDGEHSLDEAVERGIIATRQLAKRQTTWMRNRLKETLALTLIDPTEHSMQSLIDKCISDN